jgi:ribonucleoside-diphosphate reductase alpha chain
MTTEQVTLEEETRINYHGIKIHRKNPAWLSDLSKAMLHDGDYIREGESIPQALARPAINFCYGDYELAQRIYDYCYKNFFMYASPVLSNATAGTWHSDPTKDGAHYWHQSTFIPNSKPHGQPISCFALEALDTINGQEDLLKELARLSVSGGGVGIHNSIRATTRKAPGPIPYEKLLDSAIGYFKQSGTRKGAVAYYMNVDHPDVKEHVAFRVPGGDTKRRSDNRTQFHSAVNLTDEFIAKIVGEDPNLDFDLKCPHSHKVYETVNARELWEEMIETRALTGEPFMMKIDLANRRMPDTQKALGLKCLGSNICTEITLPTDEFRTFVCCLSSLNLELFDDWKDTTVVQDLIRFLDNVVQWFIDTAPDPLKKAKFSAERERALGLGAFGFHSYLQKNSIPLESGGFNSAVQRTHQIFSTIRERAEAESIKLGSERGEAPDMKGTGRRNSRLMAIAPNANSADIANTSASCEPWYRNVFVKDTRAGVGFVRNPHLEILLEKLGSNNKTIWKSISDNHGSIQHLDFIDEHNKKVFRTAMEMDQHWLVELAEARGQYVDQAQSLNLFFPFGSERAYVNSVHMKFLRSPNVITLYYFRTEREVKVDNVKHIQRTALTDWSPTECVACSG